MNELKFDFIFISGTGNLEYYKLKKIEYFSEQMSYVMCMKQIIYLLKIQNKKGSFVLLFKTCDTIIFRKIIALLQNYYKELYLFKNFIGLTNLTYIIGYNFYGISIKDLKILEDINNSIYLNEQNIFDLKLREKYNITLEIDKSKQTDIFLHNIFDIEYEQNNKIISKFNKEIFYRGL